MTIFTIFRNVITDLTTAAFMEELTRPVVRVFTSHGTGSLVLPIHKCTNHKSQMNMKTHTYIVNESSDARLSDEFELH